MKLISWNVNGLRACCEQRLSGVLQGSRRRYFLHSRRQNCRRDRSSWIFRAIISTGNYAERKGYSGTAVFAKQEPLSVSYGIGIPEHDREGRVITLEYPEFYLVTVYTPNSRMSWPGFLTGWNGRMHFFLI